MQNLGLMRSQDDDEMPERKFTRTRTHTMIFGTRDCFAGGSDVDVDWLSVEMVLGMWW